MSEILIIVGVSLAIGSIIWLVDRGGSAIARDLHLRPSAKANKSK